MGFLKQVGQGFSSYFTNFFLAYLIIFQSGACWEGDAKL